MATAIDDLWPDDLSLSPDVVPPIAILKQQASILGRKTKNLVEAIVETSSSENGTRMQHSFILVAPALNFYRYPLFYIWHTPARMYPVFVVATEIDKAKTVICKSEVKFKDTLARIFAAEKTKNLIGNLVVQSASVITKKG